MKPEKPEKTNQARKSDRKSKKPDKPQNTIKNIKTRKTKKTIKHQRNSRRPDKPAKCNKKYKKKHYDLVNCRPRPNQLHFLKYVRLGLPISDLDSHLPVLVLPVLGLRVPELYWQTPVLKGDIEDP